MKNILRKVTVDPFPFDTPIHVSHSVIPNNRDNTHKATQVVYIRQHGQIPAWGAETLNFKTEQL